MLTTMACTWWGALLLSLFAIAAWFALAVSVVLLFIFVCERVGGLLERNLPHKQKAFWSRVGHVIIILLLTASGLGLILTIAQEIQTQVCGG